MYEADLRQLSIRFSQAGRLEAILLRPQRGVACVSVESVRAITGLGLEGDRSTQPAHKVAGSSKRQVTLLQAEHLPVIAALTQQPALEAAWLRRNLLISGLNLLAAKRLFKDQQLQLCIGEAVFEISGPCEPCSKMERILGPGGYNAMRGHGGVTARVLQGGWMAVGDTVQVTSSTSNTSLFD